jgi:oxygen-independent coproporphyrinogen-3 oxidase
MDAGPITNPAGDTLGRYRESDELPGLYIHIPFCVSKCVYCDFYSSTDLTLIRDFLTAFRREISLNKDFKGEFDTVYIGGGTPSVLTPADLERLIGDVLTAFTITPGAEITVEANPADITECLLASLRRSGVNRLNIGVQSLNDGILAFLGRRHNQKQAEEAIAAARSAGIENIGIDLIYGLPGQGGVPGQEMDVWLSTLRMAVALSPDHISCYQLTMEEGTALAERCRRGEVLLPEEALHADYFCNTSLFMEENSYLHYEVSNFARHGRESRHNRKYWNHVPYLGLGPAAHSFDGRRRWWNHRSVKTYGEDLAAGRPPIADSERLTDEQLRLEALFLGLRTRRGIHLADFKRRYGQDLLAGKKGFLKKLMDETLVEIRDGYLTPTRSGMAVADSLALI